MFRFFAAVLCVAVAASVASAQSSKPIALQLKPVVVAAKTDKGYVGKTTVTAYLEVLSDEAVTRTCGRVPRVLEAIITSFEVKPVNLADMAFDIASRQNDLKDHIESYVGTDVFYSLHLVSGTRRRGEGSELVDHDAASRECQPIAYLPWEKHKVDNNLAAKIADDIDHIRHKQETLVASEAAQSMQPQLTQTEPMPEPDLEIVKKPFPGPPKGSGPSWPAIALVLMAMGGVMLVIGSYIGYQVGKIRRDRRRKDRRKRKRDRRAGTDRRVSDSEPPKGVERRGGEERRAGSERRTAADRRKGPRGGK